MEPDKVKRVSPEEAEREIAEGSKKITQSEVEKVTKKADEIIEKFQPKGPLGRFMDDARLLLDLVGDYWSGRYREIPYWSLAAIVFALLYVLNPFDIVPDALPVIGLLDDAAVIGACLVMVEQDLAKYTQWKQSQAGV